MNEDQLQHDHQPEQIAARLAKAPSPSYLGDATLGAMDGCVTTFATISGAVGAGLSARVAIIMGAATLVADGVSMAISNYESAKIERQRIEQLINTELSHIERIPEGEKQEIREIFRAKGFDGELLESVTEVITANPQLWLQTMLTEEHGVSPNTTHPVRAGLVTLLAFITVGVTPLLPFFVSDMALHTQFGISGTISALMFFLIGSIKGKALQLNWVTSGIKTLISGGFAAAVAFFIGEWVAGLIA